MLTTYRTGYHIVLGVWMVADSVTGFYNAVDVNFVGGGTV
ncbi:MAG: lytic polysaccharide monooxygenase [Candidatus Malihini olakiniferum]